VPGGSSNESLNLDPFASSVTAGPNTNTGGGGATDGGISSLLPDTGAVTYPVANPNTGITTTLGTGPDYTAQTQIPYENIGTGGNTITPDFGPDNGANRIDVTGYKDPFTGELNPGATPYDFRDFGGGGGGGGGSCPAPWVPILLADGSTREAGSVEPGMQVWTRHEHTNEWGAFPITAVSFDHAHCWKLELTNGNDFVGTSNHRVLTDKGWEEIQKLTPGAKLVQPEGFGIVLSSEPAESGTVVKITVDDAHTYVSSGFVSHNIKESVGYTGYTGNEEFARGGIAALPKSPGQKLLAAHRAGDMATVRRMLRKVRR
jgi:hypothetical protein